MQALKEARRVIHIHPRIEPLGGAVKSIRVPAHVDLHTAHVDRADAACLTLCNPIQRGSAAVEQPPFARGVDRIGPDGEMPVAAGARLLQADGQQQIVGDAMPGLGGEDLADADAFGPALGGQRPRSFGYRIFLRWLVE